MLVYAGLLLFPLSWAIAAERSYQAEHLAKRLTILLLIAFIGLRYQVGGDWDNYLHLLRAARIEPLGSALLRHDPGYRLLSFLVARGGGNIALVNLICATLFVTGLIAFCWRQAERSLALLIATPVLIATMALGFTRQSAAVGLVMAAAAAFLGGRRRWALLLLLAAPAFHWTAFAAWPSAWLTRSTIRARTAVIWGAVIAALLVGAYLLLIELQMFVDHRGIGAGAPYRAFLHLPALLAMAWIATGKPVPVREQALMKACLPTAVVAMAVLPVMPTAADRIGFYLVGFQILTLSRTIAVLDETRPGLARIAKGAVIGLYLAFFLAWLGLTHGAGCMSPYRSYLQGRRLGFSDLYDQYRTSPACAPGA